MMKFLLQSYDYLQSYSSLKSEIYVHISPIFSCWITYDERNYHDNQYYHGIILANQ